MNQDVICSGPLTKQSLTQALDFFQRQLRPQKESLYTYIPKGKAVQGHPNNLLRVPFPCNIAEVHTGYFLGRAPTISFQKASDAQLYDQASARLELCYLLFDAAQGMSICGFGYLLVWPEQSGVRVCRAEFVTKNLIHEAPCQLEAISGGLSTLGTPANLGGLGISCLCV